MELTLLFPLLWLNYLLGGLANKLRKSQENKIEPAISHDVSLNALHARELEVEVLAGESGVVG